MAKKKLSRSVSRPAIKCHGGKFYLAPRIVSLMRPHTRYAEPYFGGGAVLFCKAPDGVSEFVNDINADITNFWVVLQQTEAFERFRRRLEATPLSEWEFRAASEAMTAAFSGGEPNVERAVHFFIRCRMSRQALHRDYCTPTSRLRRQMNENVSAWLSSVEGLADVHQRLRCVEIRNTRATDFIRQLDSPSTLFYCDPTYLHEDIDGRRIRSVTDAYAFEMTLEDHVELLKLLSDIRGTFLLSGYPSKLYESYRDRHGWDRIDIAIDNKASAKKSKEKVTESIWSNRELTVCDLGNSNSPTSASTPTSPGIFPTD